MPTDYQRVTHKQLLLNIYMEFHVSELRSLPSSVVDAWKAGQQIWQERKDQKRELRT